jgi:hypothetical protein
LAPAIREAQLQQLLDHAEFIRSYGFRLEPQGWGPVWYLGRNQRWSGR